MKRSYRLLWLITAALLSVLTGCGGGGGGGGVSNTTGTLKLAASPTMSITGSVAAVATYTNPTVNNPQGLEVSFNTNHPEWFGTWVAPLGTDGTAAWNIKFFKPIAGGPAVPTTVTVTASLGSLAAQTAKFTLNPAKMTVTPPPSASYTGLGSAGSTARIIPSGTFVIVMDGDGNPLEGVPVTITVDNIINGSPGDVLFWDIFPGGTSSAPGTPFIRNTDSLGRIPMSLTIDVVVPSVTHVVNVNWNVSFTDPQGGGYIHQSASSLLTVSP